MRPNTPRTGLAWTMPLLMLTLTVMLMASGASAADLNLYFRETWKFEAGEKASLRLSVFQFERSRWTKKEIRERIEGLNSALKTCGVHAEEVHYYVVDPGFDKVRVDEYSKITKPDGMRRLLSDITTGTHFNLFYFDEFLLPPSSGGVFPLAVYHGIPRVDPALYGSAWFPFLTSARMQGRSLPYSEEAHEVGHLLLQSGHDHSGARSVMAGRSVLRNNQFTQEQCEAFRVLSPTRGGALCSKLGDSLVETFRRHFYTYNQSHYMALYCVRNSENLFRSLKAENLLGGRAAHAVYMIHKEERSSLTPRAPRHEGARWSNHAFLVVDGLVLDQDFTRHPVIMPLAEYMKRMWGEEGANFLFQVRDASLINGYTNYEVRESFRRNEFPTYDSEGLLRAFSASSCVSN